MYHYHYEFKEVPTRTKAHDCLLKQIGQALEAGHKVEYEEIVFQHGHGKELFGRIVHAQGSISS